MPLSARIESLKKRHTDIEDTLSSEEKRPAQDEAKIAQLKKEKLTLKDEISRLEEEQSKAA